MGSVFSMSDNAVVCTLGRDCSTSSNLIAKKVSRSMERVQAFFEERFGLKPIHADIGIGWDQENAAWTCTGHTCQWVFSNLYAMEQSIVAHEYTHAVIMKYAPLNTCGQAGALNESCADVSALVFMDWTGSPTWKIASRDASEHSDMDEYKSVLWCRASNDYGYVHHNSKIPTHAFFKAVEIQKCDISGSIANVWVAAMLNMSRGESFSTFAYSTIEISKSNKTTRAVILAWIDVGVLNLQPERGPSDHTREAQNPRPKAPAVEPRALSRYRRSRK